MQRPMVAPRLVTWALILLGAGEVLWVIYLALTQDRVVRVFHVRLASLGLGAFAIVLCVAAALALLRRSHVSAALGVAAATVMAFLATLGALTPLIGSGRMPLLLAAPAVLAGSCAALPEPPSRWRRAAAGVLLATALLVAVRIACNVVTLSPTALSTLSRAIVVILDTAETVGLLGAGISSLRGNARATMVFATIAGSLLICDAYANVVMAAPGDAFAAALFYLVVGEIPSIVMCLLALRAALGKLEESPVDASGRSDPAAGRASPARHDAGAADHCHARSARAGDTRAMAEPVVAITGARGLIGSALTRVLREDGVTVRHLVRRSPAAEGEIAWQPGELLDPRALTGVTAVVHLAGAGVGDHRWTDAYKREILHSRVDGTDTIARAVAAMDCPPSVLVSASAIGFYGDTGDREVDETAPKGSGFLADVVEAWEAAAEPAREAGIRVVHPRTGLVVSSRGGAWARMFPLFRAGLGGKLGSGRQYWSWISMRDEVEALRLLIASNLEGPVNLTAQSALTNAEITEAMGEVLRRPTALPVPALALKAVLGEFSTEVLGSIRVRPGRLAQHGFVWRDHYITDAIRAAQAGW